jgi:hypothetical protein
MKFKLTALLILLLFFAKIGSSQALNASAIRVTSADCSGPFGMIFFEYDFDLPLTDDDGAGRDFFGTYLFDDSLYLWGGGEGEFTIAETFPHVSSWGVPFDLQARSLEILVIDIPNYTGFADYATLTSYPILSSLRVSVDDVCGRTYPTPSDSDVVMPPDERINWQYGDLNAVLYRGEDEQGNPALNLYCYDGENASLGFQITAADLENAPIEANGCDATFYVLDTGELQVNIRDAEGKLYEIICDDLACESPNMRYFDPNE